MPNWRSWPSDDHADVVCERRGVLEIVRDEDGRQRELDEELLELGAHRSLRVRVERGQRLVEQDRAGPAGERARERNSLTLATRERSPAWRRQGVRYESARETRRRAPCPRTRRSDGRSGAGRARTPGRRARRAARPACGTPCGRCPARRRRRARSARARGRTSPAIARSTDVLPAPDGPTRATVRSTSSASSSSNERRGRVKSALRIAIGKRASVRSAARR